MTGIWQPQVKPEMAIDAIALMQRVRAVEVMRAENSTFAVQADEYEETRLWIDRYDAFDRSPVYDTAKAGTLAAEDVAGAIERRILADLAQVKMIHERQTVLQLPAIPEFVIRKSWVAPHPAICATLRYVAALREIIARTAWYIDSKRVRQSRFLSSLMEGEQDGFILFPPMLRVTGDDKDVTILEGYILAADMYRNLQSALGAGWEPEMDFRSVTLGFRDPMDVSAHIPTRLVSPAPLLMINCRTGAAAVTEECRKPFSAIRSLWQLEAESRQLAPAP
jgi:hypothetical protein